MTNKEYLELSILVMQMRKNKKGYITYLQNKFNCSKDRAREIFDSLKEHKPIDNLLNTEEKTNNTALVIGDGYTFNPVTDKYIVPLTTLGENFIMPGVKHRALLSAYSNWKGEEQSITKLARTFKMRRECIKEYLKVFGFTHDSIPITDEELTQDNDKAVKRALDSKRTILQQELLQADWKQTQEDAEKWNLFEAGKLDPFASFLSNWVPKTAKSIPAPTKSTSKETLVIGLSDLHFGGKAREEVLYSGKTYNSDKIRDIVRSYAKQINQHIDSKKQLYSKVAVLSLGDILHTLTGYTVKGTALEADVIGEEQFDLAMDCLVEFFTDMLIMFPYVEVYATKGNHAGVGDYILFKAIEAYFRKEKRIKFNLSKARQYCFRLGNTAILMDHGASDVNKSQVPANGSAKEAYIQALFLEYPEVLTGAKSKLMIQGDKHRFLCEELKGFEHIILSSCVLGDSYADNLGLHSRPRQNCLILDDNGLKQILHFYFD